MDRVNRAFVLTAGTSEVNEGAISVSVGGNLQAYIETTEGQTHQTHYTVPDTHTLIVAYFSVGVGRMTGSTDCQVQSKIKLAGANGSWRTISDLYLYNSAIYRNEKSVTILPPGTEVRQLITSTATTQVFGVWGGYLIDNDVI
jgi:hypothetical protein